MAVGANSRNSLGSRKMSVRLPSEEGLYGPSMKLGQVHRASLKGYQGLPCDYNLLSHKWKTANRGPVRFRSPPPMEVHVEV
jgi:hypothetical protein